MQYDEFERDWLRKHKAFVPRKQRVSSAREFFWIGFWLLVAAGAAVFSGSHTIPAAEMTIFHTVPNRDVLAITAFIIVELVIFGAAAGRHEIRWLKWLLLACVLVALVGNISSSARAVTENGGDALNQVGGVLLSIIAPITALAAGEVLHIQLDKRSRKYEDALRLYDEKMVELQAKINTAYKRYEKDSQTDSRQTPRLSTPVLSAQTDNRQLLSASGYGYARTSDGQQRVVEYLNEHPEEAALPLRALAERIGVNKDTVNAGRKLWRTQQQRAAYDAARHPVVSTNGHSSEAQS